MTKKEFTKKLDEKIKIIRPDLISNINKYIEDNQNGYPIKIDFDRLPFSLTEERIIEEYIINELGFSKIKISNSGWQPVVRILN